MGRPRVEAFQIKGLVNRPVYVIRNPHDNECTLGESLDGLNVAHKIAAILAGGENVVAGVNGSVCGLHLISLSRCGFHHHARSLLSIFGNRKLESCEFLDSFFRRFILCETVKSDFQIFPKPLPALELRPMDTLAKSNLAHSIPPPLVGLAKVSPPYRFGMIVARAYPTFGGYAMVVRLFTTLHRGSSPPHVWGIIPYPTVGGLCSLSAIRGVFLFSLQWGVEPPKPGGGINIVSNPYLISQFNSLNPHIK